MDRLNNIYNEEVDLSGLRKEYITRLSNHKTKIDEPKGVNVLHPRGIPRGITCNNRKHISNLLFKVG